MAGDLDIFALLARSIDTYVAEDVPHLVVVPGADVPAFRAFETERRRIIAQEDILPVRVWKLLPAIKAIKPLRRPLYVAKGRGLRLHSVRGWMLQQLLKIEMSRRAEQRAVMHVDSDVCFIRPAGAEMAFEGGKTRAFRAIGATKNPLHKPWITAASDYLGIPPETESLKHYIENCVIWDSDVARAMVTQIETTLGHPYYQAILAAPTMSEYYLYGIFAETFGHCETLNIADVSVCQSYWPPSEDVPVEAHMLQSGLMDHHRAVAVQSTHALPLAQRKALYEELSA